ncbi:MAG: Winged helix-turn-helix DNA-binding [Frankiales bacterium]|nr:Winged helix-turn-helix DNA-binding [Frankiales bacterium]
MTTARMAPPGFYTAAPAQKALANLLATTEGNVTAVAELLRVDRSTVYRVLRRARLRYDAADAIAVALGRHPVELWPDWYDSAPHDGGRA